MAKRGRPAKYTTAQMQAWLPFLAVPDQRTVETVLDSEGRMGKAAKALHLTSSALTKRLDAINGRAQRAGWMPEFGSTHPIPAGMRVKGISSNVDELGNVKQSWVKLEIDREAVIKQLMENLDVFFEDIKGKSTAPTKVRSLKTEEDLMTWYPIGDHHMGMYAWAAETGADWDTDTAFAHLKAAIDRLVDAAPASQTAAILNVGDFFHMDNTKNVTLQSGNILDVDTRWGKVVKVGMMALRYCVERALDKHQTVYLYNQLGNHDRHSTLALALAMEAFFDNNPRVVVSTSPATFQYHEFGRCLVGMTHGDTVKKLDNYVGIMADDQPEAWGRTQFRYWYLGHIHTSQRYEFRGVLVETFRTLAARDAWHASMGYGSGRDMTAIVLHKDYGEVERHTVPVQRLLAEASN